LDIFAQSRRQAEEKFRKTVHDWAADQEADGVRRAEFVGRWWQLAMDRANA
jgi:uncharacterized protein YggL (DUF469 family)